MTQNGTIRSLCNIKALRALEILHDVEHAPKKSIYDNYNGLAVINELISRGFIVEKPVAFSPVRLCAITERGKALYEALTVVEAIWASDPDSVVKFGLYTPENAGSAEETPAETAHQGTNAPAEVSEYLSEDNGLLTPDSAEGVRE